ncbi:hypothetical protein GCM10010975_13840 [Comamonas phosphati]|nr:hypothetical protein GCM10010975_13840 [Comamonas phosphati]
MGAVLNRPEFLRERENYVALSKKMFELSRAGEKEQALALLNGESLKLYNDSTATLLKLNSDAAKEETHNAEQIYVRALWVELAVAALAAGLAVIAAFWLVRGIRGPLTQAVQVADHVAGGDLSRAIHVQRHDETGQLLLALERMRTSLVQTVRTVHPVRKPAVAMAKAPALAHAAPKTVASSRLAEDDWETF